MAAVAGIGGLDQTPHGIMEHLLTQESDEQNVSIKAHFFLPALGPTPWPFLPKRSFFLATLCSSEPIISPNIKGQPGLMQTFSSGSSGQRQWFSSVAQSCPTLCDPWTAGRQASLSITNSQSLLKLMSIESVMPSNHLNLYHPLLLLPSVFLSIRVFSNESVLCYRWPKYWNFIFGISPSNEYSELISFRIDWLDLLAVQGTLKSVLQHHSSKASLLQCSAFLS